MENSRIKAAVEFLTQGQGFRVGDLRLEIENDTIFVIGWSQSLNLENLTRNQSLRDLEEIKILFNRMLHISTELQNFAAEKKILYKLYFDEYGKGSIIICSEMDRVVNWCINLK